MGGRLFVNGGAAGDHRAGQQWLGPRIGDCRDPGLGVFCGLYAVRGRADVLAPLPAWPRPRAGMYTPGPEGARRVAPPRAKRQLGGMEGGCALANALLQLRRMGEHCDGVRSGCLTPMEGAMAGTGSCYIYGSLSRRWNGR